jgi:hypothetical protein
MVSNLEPTLEFKKFEFKFLQKSNKYDKIADALILLLQ